MKNLVLEKAKFIWNEYGMSITIFSVSRIIIYFVFILVSAHSFGEARVDRWDAQHYLSIAEKGYQFQGEYKNEGALIAFFPFYPIVIKVVHFVFRLSFINAALLISFFSGIGSAILLFKLVSKWKGKEVALTAVSLFSFYPFSIFLSVPYTESLFVFLVLLTLYFFQKRMLVSSIATVSLLCLTKITGGILGFIFVWQILWKTKSLIKTFFFSFCAGIPLFAFLYFQYMKYGTPFAFLVAQEKNWGHNFVFPWSGFIIFAKSTIYDTNLVGMRMPEFFMLLLMIGTLIFSFKKIPQNIWIFGVGILLLTLCNNFILGMGRYLMLILPFYFYWGWFLSNRSLARQLVLIISACWMVFNTILFSLSKYIF
ncbi:MAG: mannosyltransferase family protein [Candidatus Moraniibacteriota bacterium]